MMYMLASADWSICNGFDVHSVWHDKDKAQREANKRNAAAGEDDDHFQVLPIKVGDPQK